MRGMIQHQERKEEEYDDEHEVCIPFVHHHHQQQEQEEHEQQGQVAEPKQQVYSCKMTTSRIESATTFVYLALSRRLQLTTNKAYTKKYYLSFHCHDYKRTYGNSIMSRLSFWTIVFLLIFGNDVRNKPQSNSSYFIASAAKVNLDCDPCIDRSRYKLQAILYFGDDYDDGESRRIAAVAMMQASRDMGVQLEIVPTSSATQVNETSTTTSNSDFVYDDTHAALISAIQNALTVTSDPIDALIVMIPNEKVANAIRDIQEQQTSSGSKLIPIFGLNVGTEIGLRLRLDGYIDSGDHGGDSNSPLNVGQVAAMEFLNYYSSLSSNNASTITPGIDGATSRNFQFRSAVFVDSITEPTYSSDHQYATFRQTLVDHVPDDGSDITVVARVTIDPNDLDHERILDLLFDGCPYQAVLLNSKRSVPLALQAQERNGCVDVSQIGVTHVSTEIYRDMIPTSEKNASLLFAIDSQLYLQSSLIVLLAAQYAMTGKKLNPTSTPGNPMSYLTTGPIVISELNIPPDKFQACQTLGFPVCGGVIYDTSMAQFNITSSNSQCECIDRSKIKIGGVVHGSLGEPFWELPVSESRQAAKEMGIKLDFIQFKAVSDDQDKGVDFVQQQMAVRIDALCSSGDLNGLFVTIPGNVTIDHIQTCLDLRIPVVAINVGAKASQELGLMHFIAQDEYNAGYQGGLRLLELGMKYGFCLNHVPGLPSLIERCRGFEDAILQYRNSSSVTDSEDYPQYIDQIIVPVDNRIQFKENVQLAVKGQKWEEVGLLSLGSVQMDGLRYVYEEHTKLIAGTFDLGEEVLAALSDGVVKFAIDQQSYIQGSLPVYLLSYYAFSRQRLLNTNIESGASMVTEPPSDAEKTCEANLYKVCEAGDVISNPNHNIGNFNDSDSSSSTEPFIQLDCDPCILRPTYSLHAVLYGDPTIDYWREANSSMHQSASNMGVNIEIEFAQDFDTMSKMILQASSKDDVNGLIVTIPDSSVQSTLQEIAKQATRMPIFGMSVGADLLPQTGLQGYIGQNDTDIGKLSAGAFLTQAITGDAIQSAVVVMSISDLNSTNTDIFNSFRKELGNGTEILPIIIDPKNENEHKRKIDDLFQGGKCPGVILLIARESVPIAMSAKVAYNCNNTLIGVTDVSLDIYRYLTDGSILFGVEKGIYLQSTLAVVLASVYVTTGKAISLPMNEKSYFYRSRVITDKNVPSDSVQRCEHEAFPICGKHEKGGKCDCKDRSTIVIGGVLHGVTTDSFWDPVFASATQAAKDLGVKLELQRFEPQTDDNVLHDLMIGKIQTLCASGIQGLFVTLPIEKIVREVNASCLEKNIPVISINTGADFSKAYRLYHHIAQVEYRGGYLAGLSLIEQGMKVGYCLDHAPGNPATAERCEGFKDALQNSSGTVLFVQKIDVPADNVALFKKTVEEVIGNKSNAADWDGVGILCMGQVQINGIRAIVPYHPKLIAGIFDISNEIYESIEDGWLKFGIDQQPYLQGNLPVYLLTYLADTNKEQRLWNQQIESGPKFVVKSPDAMEKKCTENNFEVCLPRPDENYNLISSGYLFFGYAMFIVMAVMCLSTGIWTYVYRQQWIVRVSQPGLLLLVICGCFISSLSIPFMGVQTEYRNIQDFSTGTETDEENLKIHRADASCMAVPWLYGMGFVLSFSALFAKIQRVKLIYKAGLRMKRKTIGVYDVAYIMAFLLVIECAILTTWQLVEPLRWERKVIARDKEFPIESVGSCTYEDSWVFFVILVLFHVVCLFYALALCFQTKDINSDFAESSYISLAVAFMFQVLVLSVPIAALVRQTTEVFYFIRVTSIFLQNLPVIALLFIPKMIKYHYGSNETPEKFSTSKFNMRKNANTVIGKYDDPVSVNFSLNDHHHHLHRRNTQVVDSKLALDDRSSQERRISDVIFNVSSNGRNSSDMRNDVASYGSNPMEQKLSIKDVKIVRKEKSTETSRTSEISDFFSIFTHQVQEDTGIPVGTSSPSGSSMALNETQTSLNATLPSSSIMVAQARMPVFVESENERTISEQDNQNSAHVRDQGLSPEPVRSPVSDDVYYREFSNEDSDNEAWRWDATMELNGAFPRARDGVDDSSTNEGGLHGTQYSTDSIVRVPPSVILNDWKLLGLNSQQQAEQVLLALQSAFWTLPVNSSDMEKMINNSTFGSSDHDDEEKSVGAQTASSTKQTNT